MLCTHQLQYLSTMDHVITLDAGTVQEAGTFEQLIANPDGTLSRIMAQHTALLASNQTPRPTGAGVRCVPLVVGGWMDVGGLVAVVVLAMCVDVPSEQGSPGKDTGRRDGDVPTPAVESAGGVTGAPRAASTDARGDKTGQRRGGSLMEKEERAVGSVKAAVWKGYAAVAAVAVASLLSLLSCWHVALLLYVAPPLTLMDVMRDRYMSYIGPAVWVSILVNYLISIPLTAGPSWWLTQWSSQSLTFVPSSLRPGNVTAFVNASQASTPATTSAPAPDFSLTMYYLGIYSSLVFFGGLAKVSRAFLFVLGGLKAARRLHHAMFASILRAPVAFFDTTPTGRGGGGGWCGCGVR